MEFISREQADDFCREIAQDKKGMKDFKVKDRVLVKYRGDCERLVVPYGVEEITADSFGKLARAACDIDKKRKNLAPVREVVLPSTLRRIADDAFCGMPALERVTVSDKNDLFVSDDGVLMNKDRTRLLCYPRALDRSEYALPETVEYIPERAFYRCKNLARIRMGEGLRTIKESAFEECFALREAVLNQGLKTVGFRAFAKCSVLDSVVLPQNLAEIGEETFSDCAVREINIPSGVKQIEAMTFDHCTKLKKVTFHEGLKAICFDAFSGCFELEEAILPDGLCKIESSAFSVCPSLKRVFIPASVTEMGVEVFDATDEVCIITVARPSEPDGWCPDWCDNDNARVDWCD